jgi:CheY-like chemotaxis protein
MLRVLIVDKAREVRRTLKAGLVSLDVQMQISDVPSGEEALLLLSLQPVDLMVADYHLPGMSGLELARRSRLRSPGLKLILLTGGLDSNGMRQAAEAGVEAYFQKPVDMDAFLSAVRRCLGLARSGLTGQLMPGPHSSALDDPERGLADKLAELRRDLSAAAVFLVDERAEIIAQAGDLPILSGDASVRSAWAAVRSAAGRFSHALGAAQFEGILCFPANGFSLFAAAVGGTNSLMAALPLPDQESRAEQLGRVFLFLPPAVLGLARLLDMLRSAPPSAPVARQPGATNSAFSQPPGADDKPASPEELAALDRLFSAGPAPVADLDAFWNAAADQASQDSSLNPDVISFDQAARLGLAPDQLNWGSQTEKS